MRDHVDKTTRENYRTRAYFSSMQHEKLEPL
jgi:hypothetical protein